MKIRCFALGDFGANCYIVSDENGNAVVIDPADSDFVLSYLQKNKLCLTAILLTHGHFDHTWGAAALKEQTDAPILCHSADVELLHSPQLAAGFFGEIDCPPCDADIVISGKQSHSFGNLHFTFVPMPGHSKGSMLLFCEDAMFSGDVIFAGSIGRTDLYGGDAAVMMDSIRQIAAMDFTGTVYPGHGQATTLQRERKSNYYFHCAAKGAGYDDLF